MRPWKCCTSDGKAGIASDGTRTGGRLTSGFRGACGGGRSWLGASPRKGIDVAVSFEDAIESLDVRLLDPIESQTTSGDRKALLAVQRSLRTAGAYRYLEIGSHLGGSVQQHLIDPRCESIVSIDKRPACQADDRGTTAVYEANSTERMLANLRGIDAASIVKITCFEDDARTIEPSLLKGPPDFCFIDGEHTHSAVLSDFRWCRSVCAAQAAICFHDSWIVARALQAIVVELRREGVCFTAKKLSGSVFGIFLGNCPALEDPYILAHSQDADRWLRRWVLLWRLREALPDRLRAVVLRLVRPFASLWH